MKEMPTQTGAELLAERLGTDAAQASNLLGRFAAGLAAALLGGARIGVGGLGSFSVVHDHAARSTSGSGTVFMPPKERIAFDPRPVASGDAARIARERLGMEAGEADGFARALAEVLGRLRTEGAPFELPGFGNLAAKGGNWEFTPDAALEELLNGLYEGLQGIGMPDRTAPAPEPRSAGLLKPVGIGLALLLLGAGGYFAIGRMDTGTAVPPSPSSDTRAATTAAAGKPAAPAAASSPDSLVLAKGHYTVIAATFSSLKSARGEASRLSALGHRIMLWPVRSDGQRYYRLVTGDFAGIPEAQDSLRRMPAGLSKNAYIQQAYKNVVIYGEQGL